MRLTRRPMLPAACLLACALWCVSGLAAEPVDPQLQQERARRRASLRAQAVRVDAARLADKAAAGGRLAILVVPVDFSDARLPADWTDTELAARLVPDAGETLHNYFRIASGGRLDLDLVIAPLVRLPADRRQYSDRDLNGFTRTRRLATESLVAVRDKGLAFRRLDNDGPDGRAGSADDDGQVDGVLILHAGPGQENDPQDGVIQPLQFFLEDPVSDDGVDASFYAVASLHSGPGIWAHETAHLLGLEDRYDPLLHPVGASEVRSVGGLGRFSLMGAGAWGTGDGYGAALPDAYSAAQVGWAPVRNLVAPYAAPDTVRFGEAVRFWSRGETGPEFFLMETRDPAAAAPFDAAVPGPGHLVVYHIDETVAEGAWQEDGPYQWHLRARLVEADGDGSLATGDDEGTAADVFPGTTGQDEFGPLTIPSTYSYASGPTGVTIGAITPVPGGVALTVNLDTARSLAFTAGFSGHLLDVAVRETGLPIAAMNCEVRAVSTPAWGYFADSGQVVADVPLVKGSDGLWRPVDPIAWVPLVTVPSGAATAFRYRFYNATVTYDQEVRTWAWSHADGSLAISGTWPGAWQVAHPAANTGTTWYRWDQAPWAGTATGPLLACVGSGYDTPLDWPEVAYGNGAHTTLTSGPIGPGVVAVRLVHGIEVERLGPGVGMDGGVAMWVGPDGREIPAVPLEGYDGRIEPGSSAVGHGRDAFIGEDFDLTTGGPVWRAATLPLPTDSPGPWRLRLDFSANSLWRARGWYVVDIASLAAGDPVAAHVATWNGDLTWTWPWTVRGSGDFVVQARRQVAEPWQDVLTVPAEAVGPTGSVPGASLLTLLPGGATERHEVRVVGPHPTGNVATAPVVVYPDGGAPVTAILGAPWPNPSAGEVRFLLDIPTGRSATLKVYDVRGRLVRAVRYGAGQRLAIWDGCGDSGRRAAAGLYLLRLEGTGPVLTRKVVLLH